MRGEVSRRHLVRSAAADAVAQSTESRFSLSGGVDRRVGHRTARCHETTSGGGSYVVRVGHRTRRRDGGRRRLASASRALSCRDHRLAGRLNLRTARFRCRGYSRYRGVGIDRPADARRLGPDRSDSLAPAARRCPFSRLEAGTAAPSRRADVRRERTIFPPAAGCPCPGFSFGGPGKVGTSVRRQGDDPQRGAIPERRASRLAFPGRVVRLEFLIRFEEDCMLKEFRDFALKGNVVDMAVGIIIGAAFGAIVAHRQRHHHAARRSRDRGVDFRSGSSC